VGYQLAQSNFTANRLNRVILISDGQANTGVTDAQIIGAGADLNDGEGIYLCGVGVGDGVNDTLLNTATDAGRGAYVYLDSEAEATRMFVQRFDEVMDVAARAVQVELQMPWYMGIERFYGEGYSTNPRAIEPQHLAPSDAMTFAQTVRPCGPDVGSPADPVQVIARWQTPLTHVAQQVSVSTTLGDLLAAGTVYLPKGAAIVAYAEALKTGATPTALQDALAAAAAADPGGTDPELTEIRGLIQRLLPAL
jgi:Ca-activated chloride channel homolog